MMFAGKSLKVEYEDSENGTFIGIFLIFSSRQDILLSSNVNRVTGASLNVKNTSLLRSSISFGCKDLFR